MCGCLGRVGIHRRVGMIILYESYPRVDVLGLEPRIGQHPGADSAGV